MAVVLTLAHSPDPDDAFMWWPLTGKIEPPREPWKATDPIRHALAITPPALQAGRLEFRALPADIEALNRRAAAEGDLDITALSVRAWADVQDRYVITSCGASFGDGYGPRLVARADNSGVKCEGCLRAPSVRIAIPGRRTTAFLMLGLVLDLKPDSPTTRFVEMPFDRIIGAVARQEVDAGLVIHEGQLAYGDAGLKLLLDVGQWWKQRTGLKLPLGINAVRRDLERQGEGTVTQVALLLRQSVEYAMARWDESVAYTRPFAEENVRRGGGEPPTIERLDAYCRMYVTRETADMGDAGREAIRRLLSEGAAAGLCPRVERVETVYGTPGCCRLVRRDTLGAMNLIRQEFGVAVQTPTGLLPITYIIGIGRNYAEHAKEQSADVPTRPMVFTKSPASAGLSGDDIVIPKVCQDPSSGGDQTDFEAELCVIIGRGPGGKKCRDVSRAEALSFVLGYCCGNDVSARWWQKEGAGGQFCRGKSFDTFCPLGPAVVPAAEIPDPQNLRVQCRVNGTTMQDGNTRDMMFPVAMLISDLSRGATLPPGTAIMTGTPSGVGMARKPPVWLKNGDVVEVEIERIGTIKSRVRAG